MDALAALRLQLEWGADEALGDETVDRLAAPPAMTAAIAPAGDPMPPPSPGAAPATTRRAIAGRPEASASGGPAAQAARAAAAAQDIASLRAAMAGFEPCGLRETASNLAFAAGDPTTGLMAIGDAPGPDEDRAGLPFAGEAGRAVDRMLGSIGLSCADLYLGLLIPWRPPGGRPPTETELALCLPFLLRHVALARPRRLLLFGQLVVREMLPPAAGRRRRPGQWAPMAVPGLADDVPALPIGSPATLLRSPGGRRDAWRAVRLLRRTLDADITVL